MSDDKLPIYGLDKEVEEKKAKKMNQERIQGAQDWIAEVTGRKFSGDFQSWLKDGLILCELINKIKPGTVTKASNSKMPFIQMQNINYFLEGCKTLGVPKHDLFVTVDLYEGKNIPVVVDCIYSLGAASANVEGYNGPIVGAKRSEKQEYNFTEEQLNQSKNTLSFQNSGGIKVDQGKSIRNEIVKVDTSSKVEKKVEKKVENNSEDDVFSQLEKLASLKEKGIITEEEFAEKKKKLLDL
jgi:transgelin